MKFLKRLVLGIIVVSAVVFGFRLWEMRDPHPAERVGRGTIAIQGARVYTSPDAPPIEHGTVLVRDGVIVAVASDVKIPSDAQLLPCNGCTVTAGFWNTHVHFTERKWDSAAWKDAATLNAQLADMLTSRGFTTVVDAGSDLAHTLSSNPLTVS
jgi:predicted amidohydrolase